MATRDSEATRRRLLDAARVEFALYGEAGARVDRIATAAGSNKQLIYAYFGGKDGLYAAVRDEIVAEAMDAVPFTADDLPGYATRLFDYHQEHPGELRLTRWSELEGTAWNPDGAGAASTERKLEAIAAAQRAGVLRADREPEALLALVLKLSSLGTPGTPEAQHPAATVDGFRALIRESVRELTAPPVDR